MPDKQDCIAQLEDRIIRFQLTTADLYKGGEDLVPIYWEENGQVHQGEMSLEDIASLDIQPEFPSEET